MMRCFCPPERIVFCLVPAVLFAARSLHAAPDFSRDVQPILAENCYQCHGPDAAVRKANLRLDKEDSTFEVRKGKAAAVRGKADQSEMVRRIFSKDPDEMMPPPDSNRELTGAQRELLKQWV